MAAIPYSLKDSEYASFISRAIFRDKALNVVSKGNLNSSTLHLDGWENIEDTRVWRKVYSCGGKDVPNAESGVSMEGKQETS